MNEATKKPYPLQQLAGWYHSHEHTIYMLVVCQGHQYNPISFFDLNLASKSVHDALTVHSGTYLNTPTNFQ